MLIASIGLDIDSDIAIVGAMLICPLMGSVLAMAYGIATLDREITVEAVAGLGSADGLLPGHVHVVL